MQRGYNWVIILISHSVIHKNNANEAFIILQENKVQVV